MNGVKIESKQRKEDEEGERERKREEWRGEKTEKH